MSSKQETIDVYKRVTAIVWQRLSPTFGIRTINYVTGVLDEKTMAGLGHAYPLILKMRYGSINGSLVRHLQLGKLKSGQFSASEHSFSIDPRTGIVVHPRREG
ncbi:MAG: hypothetical protein HY331_18310 [Chloroflexi bacterium]|nr:hypothetical protein [Chloroflexota bacterium]